MFFWPLWYKALRVPCFLICQFLHGSCPYNYPFQFKYSYSHAAEGLLFSGSALVLVEDNGDTPIDLMDFGSGPKIFKHLHSISLVFKSSGFKRAPLLVLSIKVKRKKKKSVSLALWLCIHPPIHLYWRKNGIQMCSILHHICISLRYLEQWISWPVIEQIMGEINFLTIEKQTNEKPH